MSTDKLHPLQESIRIQLGLDAPEPDGPPEGMDSWLSEYEPDMHSSLYGEGLDEETVSTNKHIYELTTGLDPQAPGHWDAVQATGG